MAGILTQNRANAKIKLADVKHDFANVNFIIYTNMGTIDTSEYTVMETTSNITGQSENIIQGGSLTGYWLSSEKLSNLAGTAYKPHIKLVYLSDDFVQRIIIKGVKGHPWSGKPLTLA